MKTPKSYWIKERINPQTGTYYVPMGQLSKTAAKRVERTIYGYNIMHPFDNETAYQARLTELRAAGERIN